MIASFMRSRSQGERGGEGGGRGLGGGGRRFHFNSIARSPASLLMELFGYALAASS